MNLKNQMTEQLIADVMNNLNHESSSYELDSNQFESAIYNDLLDQPVTKKNPLALLSENIMVLEDMTARLGFIMRENRYLMKVDEDV